MVEPAQPMTERQRLDRRIHAQRLALRRNWDVVCQHVGRGPMARLFKLAKARGEELRELRARLDAETARADRAEAVLWSMAHNKNHRADLKRRARKHLEGRTPTVVAVLQHKLREAEARAANSPLAQYVTRPYQPGMPE